MCYQVVYYYTCNHNLPIFTQRCPRWDSGLVHEQSCPYFEVQANAYERPCDACMAPQQPEIPFNLDEQHASLNQMSHDYYDPGWQGMSNLPLTVGAPLATPAVYQGIQGLNDGQDNGYMWYNNLPLQPQEPAATDMPGYWQPLPQQTAFEQPIYYDQQLQPQPQASYVEGNLTSSSSENTGQRASPAAGKTQPGSQTEGLPMPLSLDGLEQQASPNPAPVQQQPASSEQSAVQSPRRRRRQARLDTSQSPPQALSLRRSKSPSPPQQSARKRRPRPRGNRQPRPERSRLPPQPSSQRESRTTSPPQHPERPSTPAPTPQGEPPSPEHLRQMELARQHCNEFWLWQTLLAPHRTYYQTQMWNPQNPDERFPITFFPHQLDELIPPDQRLSTSTTNSSGHLRQSSGASASEGDLEVGARNSLSRPSSLHPTAADGNKRDKSQR